MARSRKGKGEVATKPIEPLETAADEASEEVEWDVDATGRHVFEEDGVTYVLSTDGYAYAEEDLGDAEVDYAEGFGPKAKPAKPTARAAASKPTAKADDTDVIPRTVATAASGPKSSMENPVNVKARAGRVEKTGNTEDAPVLLSLKDLKSGYGSLPVLHGVSVDVRRGETAVLLGLNGAGKTTTALNVCGALKAWGGTIEFDGQDITDWNTGKCVAAGVVMVPEGRRVFPDLSVEKNLQMGAWTNRKTDGWLEEGREIVYNYFPRMRERANQLAGTLSGGEQQMLAVGRGLMAKPKLLIIDEASMGLAPVIVQDVFDIISQINADGVTVLLIEQNVGALDVADLGLVMEQGRMVKQLRGERLKDRSEVTEVLMG